MKFLFTIAVITTITILSFSLPAQGQPPVSALPAGVIVMWSGALDAIPAGWALCDGSEGTPDLSNRFILGAGTADKYIGSTGGSHSHQHRTRDHTHQIDPPSVRLRSSYGYSGYGGAGVRGHFYMFPTQAFDVRPFKSGPTLAKSNSVSHLPPYYKLAFIIKQ